MAATAVQQYIAPQNEAYLKAVAAFPWETVRPGFPQGQNVWRCAPLGVVAAIIPQLYCSWEEYYIYCGCQFETREL